MCVLDDLTGDRPHQQPGESARTGPLARDFGPNPWAD
jgi:hypothetical protein